MNEVVRALTQALEVALDPRSDDRGLPVARDVAQVLALDGLERAISVCRPGSVETSALERRLRGLIDACRASGDLRIFVDADVELGKLAAEHGAVVRGAPDAPEDTLSLLDALEDLPLADDASRAAAFRTRLTAPVAAAVRASLDWLSGEEPRLPVRVRAEDSALELWLPRVSTVGVRASDAVLSAVGGSLGPVLNGSRPQAGRAGWMVRVPVAAARETYLMLVQGGFKLAVPWHSVLKLSMIARVELEASARTLAAPVLPPLAPLASGVGDHPVVLIARGLRRAYLVADQLIWRLPADRIGADPDPRLPQFPNRVRTEDGDVFRLAEPSVLLADVEPIPVPDLDVRGTEAPPPPRSDRGSVAVEPEPEAVPVEAPVEAPAPTVAVPEPSVARPAARIETLDPARVTPLPMRALVADDSIAARLFLARLLEPTGFQVRSVATASEFMRELDAGGWAIAFVDIELPDAGGREFLEDVRRRALSRGVEVVALVRDGAEVRLSGEAGVARTLTKPIEQDMLRVLMGELGFGSDPT